MKKQFLTKLEYFSILAFSLILLGLYLVRSYNYLLFHFTAEMFSVVVACGIFMFAFNSQQFLGNNHFIFLGTAYLFVACIDMLHTLAFKGMGIFHGYDANLPTQLWIIARYIESLSLFILPFLTTKKLKAYIVFVSYTTVVSVLLISVFYWKNFPVCFVEGSGLTVFKTNSEYIISLVLSASVFAMYKQRQNFDPAIFNLLVASVITTIFSELAFTFYLNVYDSLNMAGHYLKIISFYLIYKAVVENGISKPYTLALINLKKRTEELKRSNADLEQFAFIASHDLKAPLRRISSFIKILSQRYNGKLDSDANDFFGYIVHNATNMQSLIDDLLAYSRIDTQGKEFKSFDCNEVLKNALINLEIVIEESNALVDCKHLPTIKGNPIQLCQVFQNLIANAIKFCKKQPEIIIEAKQRNSEWLFSISDNGIGIEPQYIKHIFLISKRLHSDKEYTGNGIGLSICKKIVENHGGDIWVESESGRGSTFFFTIPATEENNRAE